MSDPKKYYSCTCGSPVFKYRKLDSDIHKLECVVCDKLIIAEPEMVNTNKYEHRVYSTGTIYDPESGLTFDTEYLRKILRSSVSRSLALSRSMEKVDS